MVGLVATLALSAFAGSGLADPPGMLYDPVPAHRHFVVKPSGAMVEIGPRICKNPDLQDAFNQFHHNVHHSFVPGVGVIHTLGPQDGAPGLNNDLGGELVAVRGCP
jgi:hypothetical protein